MRIGKQLSRIALAALLALGLFASRALAQEVVRVGFFAFPGYHVVEEDGRRSGYGYEFLQRLAAHAGWTYEYLGYDASYAEALEMLRRGEVDIVTSVSKTPEREAEFLFSREDIGVNTTILTVKAGATRIVEGDYATYEGIAVGMLEGNSKNANFARFAEENGFGYTPVMFADQDALTEALQSGEIDAAVTGSLRRLQDEWLIESFDANPFYVCTRRDSPGLMARIDRAIEELDLNDANWRERLRETYYATDLSGEIVMNAGERAFLEALRDSGRPLRLLVDPGWAPYAYVRDGEFRGMLPAVFGALAGRLGIDYEFIPVSGREEYRALREAGEADVVLDFAGDYYLAEEEGYKITKPYLQTSLSRLTREDFSGTAQRMAVVRDSDALDAYVLARYPEDRLLLCDTAEECAQAVLSGDADAAVLYAHTAERFVREDARNRLASAVLGETSFSYAVSVGLSDGYRLLSLLDKGVRSLTEAELDDIVAREIDAGWNADMTLLGVLYRYPGYGVLLTALFFLLLFSLAMLAARTKNQRRLRQRIARATGELEERTRELSRALEAADAANKAKTTFLNNMSHDIRTPMNAIIGYTALTAAHLDNRERAQDYLAKISQASNHLLSLINDVLDMSRIESGKITIEERPENLADILQGLRSIIQSDIHAKRLELFIDTVDVTDEEVFCDKLRVNQILLNLTSNAIKFTEPGGSVSIRVTQKPSEKPGYGLYEFCVSDTGIGMSPEFAKTVFEPFTRERTSTVSGIQGTGLGMAITKNIVDMMGGHIDVETAPGKGSAFTVRLELRLGAEHTELAPIAELSGLRGLVVDDDMVSCQSVSKMLRQIGLRAEWTLSGRAAVARTAEAIELCDPFEVYIVDWSMPEMSGVETVRRIRAIIGEESPIILMSAYDWSDIEREAREAGVTGFISKPLFASDLRRTLERSLGSVEKKDAGAEAAGPGFAGRRILLVEDNALNREIAEEILSEAGFRVDTAENGEAACARVQSAPADAYDLILMDIQMPVMDGYEAARAIRAMDDPVRSRVPIVAMTANAFEEDREKALAAGMNGHLPKPIDVEKMFALLRELLGEEPPRPAQ